MGVGETAPGFVTVPGTGLQRQEVMAEIEMDGDALPLGPIQIGIDQEFVFEVDFGI